MDPWLKLGCAVAFFVLGWQVWQLRFRTAGPRKVLCIAVALTVLSYLARF